MFKGSFDKLVRPEKWFSYKTGSALYPEGRSNEDMISHIGSVIKPTDELYYTSIRSINEVLEDRYKGVCLYENNLVRDVLIRMYPGYCYCDDLMTNLLNFKKDGGQVLRSSFINAANTIEYTFRFGNVSKTRTVDYGNLIDEIEL